MNPFTHFGRTPWTGDRPIVRHHNTEKSGHTHTSMPRAELEPTITLLELSKTVQALDRAVTVVGIYIFPEM
jgi:hypothetical protein